MFYKWCIEKYELKDSPSGDFAVDMKNDNNFPKEADTEQELKTYLRSRRACREALNVFKKLWKEYTNNQK